MNKNYTLTGAIFGLTIGLASGVAGADTPMPPPIDLLDINLSSSISRIALGSCFAPQLSHDIWQGVRASKPDIFLFLGDNVYAAEERPDTDLPYLKEAYRLLGDVKPFAELRASVPVMVTWDDHDYGMDDAGASWVARSQAEALHEHVWTKSDNDPRSLRDGVYYAKIIGPANRRVQIIMLDTRYFRSDLKPAIDRARYGKFAPSYEPGKTMLGTEQWAWLEAELRKDADVRLIVSSVAVLAVQHDMEGWRTLPGEREKLIDLISETGAGGVIFLSGDRHFSGFYKETGNVPYPLLEFMSSSMNLPITGDTAEKYRNEKEPRKVSSSFMAANFGTLDIDWERRKIVFHIRDAAGAVVDDYDIDLDKLQPAQ